MTPPPGDVLCAVDLSDASLHALSYAAVLAKAFGVGLRVLRVEPRARGGVSDPEAREHFRAVVVAAAPDAMPSGWEPLVRTGPPSAGILAAAGEMKAGLIVMGTRGRGAFARAIVGSTATAVLAASHVPVAVVPPQMTTGEDRPPRVSAPAFGAIVMPVELHVACARQLDWAVRLSAFAERPLVALHVVPPGEMRGSEADRLRALVEHVPARYGVRPVVREGRVVAEVIAAVRGERAGLVVMGRSGDAPGQTAYEVLRHTSALVLMVPERGPVAFV